MEKNDNRSVFHLRKKNAYTRLGWNQRHARHRGNSLKLTRCWEPYLQKLGKRLWDKKYDGHAAHFFVTDFRASSKTVVLGRNPFSLGISPAMMQRTVKNNQNNRHAKVTESKCIHLYNISARAVYIGNLQSACDADLLRNIGAVLVINFSSTFTRSRGGVRFCNDGFPYIHSMRFDEFVTAVLNVANFIKEFKTAGNVLLVCENGVNKSPAVAIALWILNGTCTFDEAIDHVDKRKLAYDKNWNNLTIGKLRNFLRAFEQRNENK